jgi:integrase
MVRDLNPMRDVKGYLSHKEVDKILEAASKQNTRNYVLILTLLYTGRRTSEIVQGEGFGLRPKDIDFDSFNITYRILKKKPRTRKQMDVGVPKPEPYETTLNSNPMLLEVLKKYIETNGIKPDEFLFPMSRQRVFQIVRRIGDLSGVVSCGSKALHPHHFRHTYAVWLSRDQVSKPEDIVMLKEMLQHSDIRMTMSYLRYGNSRMREMVNRFNT